MLSSMFLPKKRLPAKQACNQSIEDLIKTITTQNEKARGNGGAVIACGMAGYEDDMCAASVFERADDQMYQNKSDLKGGGHDR